MRRYLDDEFINIARGLIPGVSHVHKFGAVDSMSINTTGTVWDVNNTVYPWSAWSSAGTLTVDRASGDDADKLVYIEGLDSDYNVTSDTVTLTNETGNATTKSFIRVYRAYITDSSTTNVGAITIKRGETTVAAIGAENGQALMAVYTIPAGKTGMLMQGSASAQAGADATGKMYVRYFGQQAFRVGHTFEVEGAGGEYDYTFSVPIALPEKTDIDVRMSVRTNNGRFTAAFCIILIDN